MANKTPLASWLYSKRQELNPKFKEFNWPARVFPGVYDFATIITWNGIESNGRGVDSRREIALEKSVAEAIERLICKSIGFDSVGFTLAGTHDPEDHAKFEAMERYFLNKHLEDKIPFSKIVFESEEIQKFRSANTDATIELYRMQTPKHIFGIVCAMKTKQTTALGFGLSESLEKSVQRSMFEALPNYAWLTDEDKNLAEEIPWHVEPNFLLKIEPLLSSHFDQTDASTVILPTLTQIEVLKSELSVLSSAPIRLARFSAAAGGS